MRIVPCCIGTSGWNYSAWKFVKGHEGAGLPEGLRFGLLVAWFIAGLYLLFYAL